MNAPQSLGDLRGVAYVDEWKDDDFVVLCGGANTALARRTQRFAQAITEQRGKKFRVVEVGDTLTGAEKDGRY